MTYGDPSDNYDLDGVSYAHRKRQARKEYELEKHERDSMQEIRKRIKEDSYTNMEEVRDHLELIEDLIEKVKIIIQSEERDGLVNLSLKRDISKIQQLYNDLSRILDRLEGF
jgi:hypothetical protein